MHTGRPRTLAQPPKMLKKIAKIVREDRRQI